MPTVEIVSDNLPANTQNLDVLIGERAARIDMQVRAAVIKLLAVASAIALTHSLWVGSRNPLTVSPVSVSATPNQLIDPDNISVSNVVGTRGEDIHLYVSETAGGAANDYRARSL